ncbi:MAG: hypothetical protein EA390_08475 [Balneolaceae bacterium]|nr:MAG: hypothetical protein EA390_08475 [Balneolaceae bacterium]
MFQQQLSESSVLKKPKQHTYSQIKTFIWQLQYSPHSNTERNFRNNELNSIIVSMKSFTQIPLLAPELSHTTENQIFRTRSARKFNNQLSHISEMLLGLFQMIRA